MATIEMIRPYVEQEVAQMLGIEKVKVDHDGDIPIVQGSSVSFARLLDGPTGPMLRVFAPMLGGVQKSPELLERLNDLNSGAPYVRFFWQVDQVFCAMDLKAESLDPNEIENSISAVLFHADHLDDMLQKDFGGRKMIEDEDAKKPAKQDTAYL